jgi:hypothetical protein
LSSPRFLQFQQTALFIDADEFLNTARLKNKRGIWPSVPSVKTGFFIAIKSSPQKPAGPILNKKLLGNQEYGAQNTGSGLKSVTYPHNT